MKKPTRLRLLLSGGGTGGHLSPLTALIAHSKAKNLPIDLFFIGSKKGPEATIIPTLNTPFYTINPPKIRRYFSFQNFIDILKFPPVYLKTLFLVKKIKPDVILTSGGFVSLPAVIASIFLRIPLVIHEQTLIPGIVNKFAAKYAHSIAISFEESRKYFPPEKCHLTGNPIRPELLDTSIPLPKQFQFTNNLPVLYVTGSYQGAHFINRLIGNHLTELLSHMNIIHQCGINPSTGDGDWLEERRKTLPPELQQHYVLTKTVTPRELSAIYRSATLVLCRAGAGTVSELAAVGKAAILIPYPYSANGEQEKLAEMLEKINAAETIKQKENNSKLQIEKICSLVSNNDQLENLMRKIKTYAKPNANQLLAKLISKN